MIPITNSVEKAVPRRKTAQRDLVMDAVRTLNHPSAQEIFQAVSRAQPMSFGTVYRNLQILEEAGALATVKADPALLRYDRTASPHHHLRCRECGKVFDVPLAYDEALNTAVAEKSGFAIESHTITFEGLCVICNASYSRRALNAEDLW
jgi:Fe2+ or Zn2+ uptake regulation protein